MEVLLSPLAAGQPGVAATHAAITEALNNGPDGVSEQHIALMIDKEECHVVANIIPGETEDPFAISFELRTRPGNSLRAVLLVNDTRTPIESNVLLQLLEHVEHRRNLFIALTNRAHQTQQFDHQSTAGNA
ncbi:MAG TPA: hypothetical protein VKP88_05870 [Candidatus Paceibacterota bacterium]|nr:hypothetical protein [Candidatus Paceibacterota bacterium]